MDLQSMLGEMQQTPQAQQPQETIDPRKHLDRLEQLIEQRKELENMTSMIKAIHAGLQRGDTGGNSY